MDEEIAKWIVEFLLRQDIDDRVLNNIISDLPLPKNDSRLEKALLIRRIGTALSNGSVEEKILEILEILEELYHSEGKGASEAMKAAYCAVAVDCTTRFLEVEDENSGKFVATVKRIWKGKISKMEQWEGKADLLSDELLRWKEHILDALWEADIRGKIMSMDTKKEALNAMKKYVTEAWKDLGPSYLELVAGNVVNKKGQNGKEMADSQKRGDHVDMNGQVAGGMADTASKSDDERIDDEHNLEVEESDQRNGEETQKMTRIPTKQKQGARHSRSVPRRVPRTKGPKIVDAEELDGEICPVSNSEVPRMPEPEASKTAKGDAQVVAEDINCQKKGNQSGKVHQRSIETDDNADEGNKGYSGLHGLDDQNKHREDFTDGDFETYPVKSKAASPKRRRRKKLFTPLEEDTLRNGVKKFGKGNWKLILHAYRDIFEERTEVDLKDKWRNLTR